VLHCGTLYLIGRGLHAGCSAPVIKRDFTKRTLTIYGIRVLSPRRPDNSVTASASRCHQTDSDRKDWRERQRVAGRCRWHILMVAMSPILAHNLITAGQSPALQVASQPPVIHVMFELRKIYQ